MKMTYQASWLALVLLTYNGEVINLNLGCSDLNLLLFCLLYLSYSQISNITYKKVDTSFFLILPNLLWDHGVISFTFGKQWQWIHTVKF